MIDFSSDRLLPQAEAVFASLGLKSLDQPVHNLGGDGDHRLDGRGQGSCFLHLQRLFLALGADHVAESEGAVDRRHADLNVVGINSGRGLVWICNYLYGALFV